MYRFAAFTTILAFAGGMQSLRPVNADEIAYIAARNTLTITSRSANDITVERVINTVGEYAVNFGSSTDRHANVQVVAYGDDSGYCSFFGWKHDKALIKCFSDTGQASNRGFAVLAIKAKMGDERNISYATITNGQPVTQFGDVSPGPDPLAIGTPGRYRVRFASPLDENTVVFVTAYDSSALCNIVRLELRDAYVRCVGDHGRGMNTGINILAVGTNLTRMSTVYAFAAAGEQFGKLIKRNSIRSDRNGSPRVIGSSRGTEIEYIIKLGPEASSGGIVQGTAQTIGHPNAICWIVSWGAETNWGEDAVIVRCNRNAGIVAAAFKVKQSLTQLIPEDCDKDLYDRNDLHVREFPQEFDKKWRIYHKNNLVLFAGNDEPQAEEAQAIVANIDANRSCRVGTGEMQYLFKDYAPLAAPKDDRICSKWRFSLVSDIEILEDKADGKSRLIASVDNPASKSRTVIATLGSRQDAEKARKIIFERKFKRACPLGKTPLKLYYRFP